MRTHALGIVVVVCCLFASRTPASAQTPTGTCLPATDTTSRSMVEFLDILVSANNPEMQDLRHQLGLSNATTQQVVPITADSICTHAAIALNSYATIKRSSIPLYVTAVGNLFAVADTTTRVKGATPLWFYDSSWNYVFLLESF